MKKARRGFDKPYDCQKPWPDDCTVQCGDSGLVLGRSSSLGKVLGSDDPLEELAEAAKEDDSYVTAFFEAFPKNPSCFIRGEGKTIEEAEAEAFEKWEGILNCPGHEFEARNRTDGYGYCKHCSLSKSKVLPILSKCCKCGKPTAYSTDTINNYYCQKHVRLIPKKYRYDFFAYERRKPRKLKKEMKKAFGVLLRMENKSFKKIRLSRNRLVADNKWQLFITFKREIRRLLTHARTKI